MESKQLNKIILLLALGFSINLFSQLQMADIDGEKLTINLKSQKSNFVKIIENKDFDVFYILDKERYIFDKRHKNVDLVNLIFFSKKYNKGILAIFKQSIEYKKKSDYNITLHTNFHNQYMFQPSMIIVDNDFNYEYLMKYYYMPLPYDKNVYTSGVKIQDNKNKCNTVEFNIKGNMIYENIDDILSNISKISKSDSNKKCDPIVAEIDLRGFFQKIIK
ncbi:Uncharacterised protein [Chryseobacterium nakagawai]|uniref:Uncharacterized protein n=1 Tax=Chryseobacterium nakagawai TaxID=1241982 RepID=A0AAD0YHX1_CHRNA|nr:hypothetical protein [Chryseobacterium nakagawai]AZA89440.1 hypothetical protein EG343_01750 [Chryseobacterium nakagawai]VEH20800.1 Uncharacterised protein [Chryseobacterium nakagawai]